MRKLVRTALSAALVLTATSAMAESGTAVGFSDGWTKIKAHSCGVNGDNLFVVYPTSAPEKRLLTSNGDWFIPLSVLCSNGRMFAVRVVGGAWTDISYAPRM